MNFISFDFAIFLIAVLAGFYALPHRFRTLFLLLASYFFYGYWSIPYLFLLIATMLIDFLFAQLIEDAVDPKRKKLFLTLSLVLNLGILFVFKYFNFTMDLIYDATGSRLAVSSLILPFGISFYTFHSISYVVDVYHALIPAERNFIPYSAYVMFFPQLVAGPIARAKHLLHQFEEKKYFRSEQWWAGLWFIALGYCMKVVLADNLSPAVDAFLGTGPDVLAHTVWRSVQGIYFFAFQIYFDFAGYTSIAIGVAKLFDFELVKNFDTPYFSASITEFWRRWHISLSSWLRDYLYISLGGNRKGKLRTYVNLMLTMLLGGLWHGANVTFVIWGAMHGAYLVIERMLKSNPATLTICRKVPRGVRIFITFQLVCLAWIPFRMPDIAGSIALAKQFFLWAMHPLSYTNGAETQKFLWALIALWMLFEYAERRWRLQERFMKLPFFVKIALLYLFTAGILLFMQGNSRAFIYFQF